MNQVQMANFTFTLWWKDADDGGGAIFIFLKIFP